MINWKAYNKAQLNRNYLMRFLSEKKLFRFLDTGKIWFPQAYEFGDKMECVTINDLKADPFNFKKLNNRKHKHLISCWHNVNRESIAMWDSSFKSIKERRVYAVKFKTANLIDQVYSGYFPKEVDDVCTEKLYGRVIYKNLLRDTNELVNQKMKRVAFRKEYAFEYEKEFRFVVKGKTNFNNEGYGLKIGNPEDLNFTIMVNPLLKKDEYLLYLTKLKSHFIGAVKHENSKLVDWLKPLEW